MYNLFDLLAIIVTIGLGIAGFREGLIKAVIRLLGFVISLRLLFLAAPWFTSIAVTIPVIPVWLTVLVLEAAAFVILLVLVHFAGEGLRRVIALTPAGFIDSGLGCLVGIIKSVVVTGFLAFLLSFAPGEGFLGNQYRTSRSARTLRELVGAVIPSNMAPLRSRPEEPSPQPQEEEAPDDNTPPSRPSRDDV